jgi:hypothetical protein
MDFVHDDAFEPGKGTARILVGCQQRKAFGRRQQDMRRIRALALLAGGWRVAGAVLHPDGQAHIGDRAGQVAPDISGERLER